MSSSLIRTSQTNHSARDLSEDSCYDKKNSNHVDIFILSCVALTVLGCLGTAGALDDPTMGWVGVGFGVGHLLLFSAIDVDSMRKRNRVLTQVAFGILPLALGILGVLGVLTAQNMGWGFISPAMGFTVLVILGGGSECMKSKPVGQRPPLQQLDRTPLLTRSWSEEGLSSIID